MGSLSEETREHDREVLVARLVAATQERDAATQERDAATQERDAWQRRYQRLLEQFVLLQRRILSAKAERIDTAQIELEFAALRHEMAKLATLDGEQLPTSPPAPAAPPPAVKKPSPKGRRDLSLANLPVERVEFRDAACDARGYEVIGFEQSYRLGYKRGGPICIVVARAKYKVPAPDSGEADSSPIATAPLVKEIVSRPLLAPSMCSKILVDKFADGLPFHRQEARFAREGLPLGRDLMCRMAEDVGMTLGGIVLAARDHAMRHAFCLATDATGVAIQPTRIEDASGKTMRQACRKGNFFVTLADRDHVFFSFEPKHTSKAVCALFAGYTGYIQADAHAVYDALFRGAPAQEDEDADAEATGPPKEVGCFAHARRKFYEAAISTKDPRAREALMRIRLLFEKEAEFQDLPPQKRGQLRKAILGPWLADFFAWAETQFETVKAQRGVLASAFGYVVRQQAPLARFIEDGRLRIDNNASERALRALAVGRKNWLFFGSDDHAEAAANIMSLIASCKLHAIEPYAYLEEVIRAMPTWPRERYLELAPFRWKETRAKLDAQQLAAPFGPVSPLTDTL